MSFPAFGKVRAQKMAISRFLCKAPTIGTALPARLTTDELVATMAGMTVCDPSSDGSLSGLTLRLASLADVSTIADVVRASYGIYVKRMGKRPAPMLADYGALVAAGEVTVLQRHKRIAGVLVMRVRAPGPRRSEADLFVENVAVDPQFQGRGYGRLLMAHAEAEARRGGLRNLRLYTNLKMTENLDFYRRLGFAEEYRGWEDGYARAYFLKCLS